MQEKLEKVFFSNRRNIYTRRVADAPLRVALLSILLRGVTIGKTGKTAVLPKFPDMINTISIKGGGLCPPKRLRLT